MKKQLLAGAFILASFLTAQAQTQVHNFNDLEIGNVGTVLTGATVGQGGWYTLGTNGVAGTSTTDNITNASFQIVAGDEAHGNVFSITGPNGSGGYAVGAQLPGQFYVDGANAGNLILSNKFDFYTGTADATTKNLITVTSYSIDNDVTPSVFYGLGGFGIDLSTLNVYGQAYLDADGTSPAETYFINLSATEGEILTLPENTWVTLSYSYNIDNGDLEFLGTANGGVLFSSTFTLASELADGRIPGQVEFAVANSAAGNTVATTRQFDNVVFKAGSGSILSTETPVIISNQVSVYPNPVNDVVNVSTADALVSNVAIVDLNGRTVKSVKFDSVSEAQVNVSDLASGVYMMTISSDKGATTKKIVKN